jgi:hypothetical protein
VNGLVGTRASSTRTRCAGSLEGCKASSRHDRDFDRRCSGERLILRRFYERTFGHPEHPPEPVYIFAQLPALAVLHRPLTVAAIILAFLVAVVPKKRTIRWLAVFSTALIIAFELILLHWFYAYVIWFEPFVFVALLLATNEKTSLDGEQSDQGIAISNPQEEAKRERLTS